MPPPPYQSARSDAEVVVVDRDDRGQATAAGAGVIFPRPLPGTDPGWHGLGVQTAGHYPQSIAGLETDGVSDHGYHRTGEMTVLADKPTWPRCSTQMLTLRAEPGMSGPGEVEVLTSGEPAGLFPALSPELAGRMGLRPGHPGRPSLRDSPLRAAVQQRGAVVGAGRGPPRWSGRSV